MRRILLFGLALLSIALAALFLRPSEPLSGRSEMQAKERALPPPPVEEPRQPAVALAMDLRPRFSGAAVSEQNLELEVELNQAMEKAELRLTPVQLRRLAEVTSYYQAVRREHELTVAEAERGEKDDLRVRIPPYPEFGDMLRMVYYREVERALGSTVADAIRKAAGAELEQRFGAFGSAEQLLQFVPAAATSAEDSWILHETARIPDGGAVRTWRQSRFLSLQVDDPRGEALTLMLEAAIAALR